MVLCSEIQHWKRETVYLAAHTVRFTVSSPFSPTSCIDEWFEVNRSCPEHPSDWSFRRAGSLLPLPLTSFFHVFFSDTFSLWPCSYCGRGREARGATPNADHCDHRTPPPPSPLSPIPLLSLLHLPNNVVPQCAKSHSNNLQGFFFLFFFLLSSSCMTCTSWHELISASRGARNVQGGH